MLLFIEAIDLLSLLLIRNSLLAVCPNKNLSPNGVRQK